MLYILDISALWAFILIVGFLFYSLSLIPFDNLSCVEMPHPYENN
jgi:hypothetical protein